MTLLDALEVVCSAPSHVGRVSKIASLAREAGAWADRPREGVEPTLQNREDDDGQPYLRWSMSCRLCGTTLRARDASFQPVLDRIAAAGLAQIELVVLEAGYLRTKGGR